MPVLRTAGPAWSLDVRRMPGRVARSSTCLQARHYRSGIRSDAVLARRTMRHLPEAVRHGPPSRRRPRSRNGPRPWPSLLPLQYQPGSIRGVHEGVRGLPRRCYTQSRDPVVQRPSTRAFHARSTGSNPVRVANLLSCARRLPSLIRTWLGSSPLAASSKAHALRRRGRSPERNMVPSPSGSPLLDGLSPAEVPADRRASAPPVRRQRGWAGRGCLEWPSARRPPASRRRRPAERVAAGLGGTATRPAARRANPRPPRALPAVGATPPGPAAEGTGGPSWPR